MQAANAGPEPWRQSRSFLTFWGKDKATLIQTQAVPQEPPCCTRHLPENHEADTPASQHFIPFQEHGKPEMVCCTPAVPCSPAAVLQSWAQIQGDPPGCPAVNCVSWCMGQKRLTTGLTSTSSFLSSRAWMKQLRIRIFDVMTDWRVFLLCPMGFQWGNLFSSTVILHKQLGIHLGWELEDFQEAVQGGSGTGC